MNICICDDETSCTEYINTLITSIRPECTTYIFDSGETLLRSTIKFDIAFLDIEMKEVNGIDTASELIKRMPGIIIIFVSSYSGYVTEAFSLQAFQYLLKPVNEQKFIEEFNKALEAYKMKHYTHPIKYGNSVSYISVKDILYIESYNSEIVPGDSVNFGYTLTGDSFKFPQNIINCAERVDITDGYNVYYNITGDYGDTYQAEMIIENLSDTDISAWQLSFDGNVTIVVL